MDATWGPLYFSKIHGYPNKTHPLELLENIPTFNEHNIAQHVWDFMNFTTDLNISHEDVMMWLFPFTLKESAIVVGCSLVLSYIIAVGVLW